MKPKTRWDKVIGMLNFSLYYEVSCASPVASNGFQVFKTPSGKEGIPDPPVHVCRTVSGCRWLERPHSTSALG